MDHLIQMQDGSTPVAESSKSGLDEERDLMGLAPGAFRRSDLKSESQKTHN